MNLERKQRLVVYTVLVGDKEDLNNPLHYLASDAQTDLAIDFVCLTDNETLISPTWQINRFSRPLIPPEKMSRLPKAKPHAFFPDHDYSLYIDNTVVFKRLPCAKDLHKATFRGFRHPWRSNPLDEADVVAKSGLDAADVVAAQVGFYAHQAPLDSVGTLTAGTVLLRKHHHPAVIQFGELWWEQILLFSKRDQISLDLCAQMAGCPVEYFEGDKVTNDLFVWPVLPNGRRVLGSFDADRYAWENRSDPDAVRQPRAHFLTHGGDSTRFKRHVPLFQYACERAGSGLGDSVPPRRGIADVVGLLLSEFGTGPLRVLIVGVNSDEFFSVAPEELPAAQAAISQFFRFAKSPDIIVTLIAENDVCEAAPFRAANGRSSFHFVLVFGLTKQCHENALAKFLPLLSGNGRLMAQFGASLDIQSICRMKETVPEHMSLEVFHGRHILTDHPIPSSVFLLSV